MNNTTLVGNITRDPEIRYLQNGTATASFGLAVNRRWMDKDTGEWKEETSFFDVVAWRDLAENAVLSFRKGDRVICVGRLEQRTWTTDEGSVRSRVELVADDIGSSVRFGVVSTAKAEYENAEPF